MRTLRICFYAATACVISLACNFEARAERKIGVLMFSGESRYQDAARGMMDAMRDAGMGGPQTTFLVENAEANKARAAEIVKKFAEAKLDLIFTLGTSATIATAMEIHDVPIVFAIVYDPVETGIAKSWKTSGNNTTGTTTKLPMTLLIDVLKEFKTVKKMALLYTPGEKNSELVYTDMQKVCSTGEIKIVPVPLANKEDVTRVLPAVLRASDAIYVTGSNLIDSQIATITEMATKAKVITISHLEDLVWKGVLLGVCTDSYRGGRLAGDKAVKILNGAKPSAIPIESPGEYRLIVNRETLRAGQFRIPEVLMKQVQ